VAAAETAFEMTVLPGMIEVVASIIAPVIVTNPFAVVVHVRSLGMAFVVAVRSLLATFMGIAVIGGRTVARNISTADIMVVASFAMISVLRPGGDRKEQNYS
jgi:hypothetical protein